MSAIPSLLLNSLLPIVDKNLTDEKVNGFFDNLTSQYPVAEDAEKNVIMLSQKGGKVKLSIASVKGVGIVKIHAQQDLVEVLRDAMKRI